MTRAGLCPLMAPLSLARCGTRRSHARVAAASRTPTTLEVTVPGQSPKQVIVWTAVAALLVTVAATVLMLAAPDLAQAASDTSKKVGDEAKGWLTVLFLVVAGFAALPVIGRLDVGRGFALAALVLILGGLAFAQGSVRAAIDSIWSSIG